MEQRLIGALFIGLLVFNVWGVSVGWKNINLPGCEFRQAQTGLATMFIQRDNDFSLAYPTPVLGKPWSVPMDFPLYQWTVVVVSNATGLSLTSAARTVSAVCFYLTLPAFYLLLGSFGLNRTQRLIGLGFILTCPLYIFYARAFMMETMALMFGAWYLAALILTMEKRKERWLLLCALTGAAAGLTKVTTFILFLLPAFACSLIWLWQVRPQVTTGDWRPLLRTLGWLVAAHAIPFWAAYWWVGFSDAVKMLNPSGEVLASSNLAVWNFGIGQRFSPQVWAAHWHIFFRELISPVVGVLCLAAACFINRKWLWSSLFCMGVFLAVQLIFPVLYAWHEYYYVANAFALMAAIGLVLLGLLQSGKIPRGIALAAIAVAYSFQILTWFRVHYSEQAVVGAGGSNLTSVIKFITEPDEAIIVAGEDWNSMTPYYSERRALMLRDDIIRSPTKLDAALEHMKTTPVAVLVLHDWRNNPVLLEKIASYVGIDVRPALLWHGAVIYLNSQLRSETLASLEARGLNRLGDVTFAPEAKIRERPLANQHLQYAELSARHKKLFHNMRPAPVSFFSSIGPELWSENGEERYYAHPDTKLWFSVPPGNYRLRANIAMTTTSYVGVPWADGTDGVYLIATVVDRDGARHQVNLLHVNPRDNPANRGVMPIDWPFTMPRDGQLEIEVNAGPTGSAARDWATLGAISLDPDNAPTVSK